MFNLYKIQRVQNVNNSTKVPNHNIIHLRAVLKNILDRTLYNIVYRDNSHHKEALGDSGEDKIPYSYTSVMFISG